MRYIKYAISVSILILFSGCSQIAWSAEPDWNKLADAIFKAEHSSSHPYGIMQWYKHTTPRQACLNTLKHQYRLYLALQASGKANNVSYLRYLSGIYAPRNVCNDPRGINKNWLKNVTYFYNKETP